MSGEEFHVHGPHDHALEHEAGGHGQHDDGESEKGKADGKFIQWVAIFTAILATIGRRGWRKPRCEAPERCRARPL